MTVAELIRVLQSLPPEAQVFGFDSHAGWVPDPTVGPIVLNLRQNGRGGFNRPEGDEPTQTGVEISA